jgi:hypothetical protein
LVDSDGEKMPDEICQAELVEIMTKIRCGEERVGKNSISMKINSKFGRSGLPRKTIQFCA